MINAAAVYHGGKVLLLKDQTLSTVKGKCFLDIGCFDKGESDALLILKLCSFVV